MRQDNNIMTRISFTELRSKMTKYVDWIEINQKNSSLPVEIADWWPSSRLPS